MTTTTPRPLQRVLGLGFGLAFTFGTMVGVGILRLPGTVAAVLGDPTLIMVAWAVGGLYAVMGAFAVAELAAMFPETGGFRVYARRAFGEGVGFAVGWTDWLCCVATLAYVTVTSVSLLAAIWPPVAAYPRAAAVALVALFTGLHWLGLRVGSTFTAVISVAIGVTLLILVAGCFMAAPAAATAPLLTTATTSPLLSIAMVFSVVPALRAILTAYDGWYSPIYMAEENTNPTSTLPRSIIGGALLVVAIYLLINYAFLRVLPVRVLAASALPATDAAELILPRGGGTFVTVVSLMTVLSLFNNVLLQGPRVLYGIGRDGLFTAKATLVSEGGTPRPALALTSITVVAFVLTGSFEQIIALSAVLFLIYYISAFVAVFVLRRRLPDLARPYRALGYPASTFIVLVGSVLLLIAALAEDPRSGIIAAVFLAACAPAYAWTARRRRLGAPVLVAGHADG